MKHWKELLALSTVFTVLMALDVYLTSAILAMGGRELNPLAHPWLAHGPWGLVLQKLVALTAIMALVYYGHHVAVKRGIPQARHAYWLLTPFAAFPVIWNLGVVQ